MSKRKRTIAFWAIASIIWIVGIVVLGVLYDLSGAPSWVGNLIGMGWSLVTVAVGLPIHDKVVRP